MTQDLDDVCAPPPGVPQPSAADAEHCAQLVRAIGEAIDAAGGRIPFARFMGLALYMPGLGYYERHAFPAAGDGDFVTAPETSPLFARTLARHGADVLARMGGGDVMEVGAGSGRMAAELLTALEALGQPPGRYLIYEVSRTLRARQRATLAAAVPHLIERVVWLDTWPPRGFRGVVFANELLDAMPVHRVRMRAGAACELYVRRGHGGFEWEEGPLSSDDLTARVDALRADLALSEGIAYDSEVGLAAEAWVRALGAAVAEGVVLLIDYGFPRREFYLPERRMGTLMCHYRQYAHGDPLVLAGLQDITAHVDFTAVAEAATAGGLAVRGFTTQAHFLLACGLAELFTQATAAAGERERLVLASQVKRLTMPQEMGELFKVMALARGVEGPLPGFSSYDYRDRL